MDFFAFLGLVLVVSVSGVLMPGPLTAAVVVRSYSDKWAGAKVAIGHAFVEFPLFLVIALGASVFFEQNIVLVEIIGLIGGAYLLFFAITMLRDEDFVSDEKVDRSKLTGNAVVLGVMTTLFNPGFILWWVVFGALVIAQGIEIGLGLAVLTFVWFMHWLLDLGWGVALSFGIQKAKQFYASQVREIIRIGCAILVLVFGAYFAVSSSWSLLT
jgi:threonine/homoserine/homoserine lactone efflux protein